MVQRGQSSSKNVLVLKSEGRRRHKTVSAKATIISQFVIDSKMQGVHRYC
jgi:hypothetical protein